MRFAAWAFILLGPLPAAQWVAYGADGARPAPVLVAGGAAEDATASNNQVKLLRTSAGLVAAYAGIASGGAQVLLAASRDGGAHWSTLAQASGGSVPSRLPTLALDGAGRVHVIWTRYDDGVGKIYYRVWQGGWAAPALRISPPVGYAGYPALALDGNGHPQVVWYGIREGGRTYTPHQSIYEIYAVGFDSTRWSAPRLISADRPDAINPAIAAGRDGRLHAVWYQYDGRTYQIRYAEWDRGWTPPQGVLRTAADEFNPDVAVDAAGGVVLVWEHHDGRRSTIEYARRSGGRWGDAVPLSAGTSSAHHPSVTVAGPGDLVVVWDEDDGQIYLRRRTSGGWQPAARLTTGGGNTFPSGSADASGVDLVWTHTAAGTSGVYFMRAAFR